MVRRDVDDAIRRWTERQNGMIASWQLHGIGASSHHLRRRIHRGHLQRLDDAGVYRLTGAPTSWAATVTGAVLSCGPVSAASHRTSAHLWGLLERRPDTIEVSVRRGRIRRRSFVVHHSRDLDDTDIQLIDGVPVVSPAWTVLDLCATDRMGVAARAFDRALRAELCTALDVGRLIGRVARQGRTGVRVGRILVAERMGWAGRTQSELEDRFRRLVAQSRLPAPVPQLPIVHDGRVVAHADFGWPAALLAVELDGWSTHADQVSFRIDRQRQNRIIAAGYRLLRYTWWDLDVSPDRVVAEIEALHAGGTAG